jgi:hypothetical protein
MEDALTPEKRATVCELLSKWFDTRTGLYSGDYSDRRIAREVGVHILDVVELRERGFGKRQPSQGERLQALAVRIAELRAEYAAIAVKKLSTKDDVW